MPYPAISFGPHSRLEQYAELNSPWVPSDLNDEYRRWFGTCPVVMAGPLGYRASASRYVLGPLRETIEEARADLDALDTEGSAMVGDPAFGSWAAHAFREVSQ